MKSIIMVLLLSGASSVFALVDKNTEGGARLASLLSTYPAAFPTGANLVIARIHPNSYDRWNLAVKGLGEFVKAKNSDMYSYFTELSNINEEFNNTRKVVFGRYIIPTFIAKNEKELNKLKTYGLDTIDSAHLNFSKVYSYMGQIKAEAAPILRKLDRIKTIEKDTDAALVKYRGQVLTPKVKGDCAELLKMLAQILGDVINKYKKDLKKLDDAVTPTSSGAAR